MLLCRSSPSPPKSLCAVQRLRTRSHSSSWPANWSNVRLCLPLAPHCSHLRHHPRGPDALIRLPRPSPSQRLTTSGSPSLNVLRLPPRGPDDVPRRHRRVQVRRARVLCPVGHRGLGLGRLMCANLAVINLYSVSLFFTNVAPVIPRRYSSTPTTSSVRGWRGARGTPFHDGDVRLRRRGLSSSRSATSSARLVQEPHDR